MREIKFRIYDKEKKIIKPVIQIIFGNLDDKVTRVKTGITEELFNTTKERFILMQYTGLKDKNGKEIYEGDIVKIFASVRDLYCRDINEVCEVKYFNCAFCLENKYSKDTIHNFLVNIENYLDIEVIRKHL